MSPKLAAIKQRKPKPASAQTADSREEPQPKFSPEMGAAIAGLVEHKIRIVRPVGQIAIGLERECAEFIPLMADQPLRRDDDIGVDVVLHERRSRAGDADEFLHGSPELARVGNGPAIAAAAAIAGLARWVRALGP